MDKEPAGSLEPYDKKVAGTWYGGIDATGITQLDALAKDINKTVDATVKHVARGKIKVGKLLIEARAFFSEDKDFGLWRRKNTMVQSKQHAHYLMQVARRFSDAVKLIDGANYSIMQELVLADEVDIKWVEDRIDSNGPLPTVIEVRKKVKKTQVERLAPKGTSKKGMVAQAGPIVSPNAAINLYVSMGLTRRIQAVVSYGIKGIEGDLIILGMDPDPQCPCHPDLLEVIQDHWLSVAENDDEKRAVIDSTGRVIQEFENWK